MINNATATPGTRECLSKYYSVLGGMEARFPVSRAPDHVHVTFAWSDAFRPNKRTEQANIHFEKAAILFNIGAAISQQALGCDRRTSTGLRDSAKLFQEAAGAFGVLRDSVSLKIDAPRPVDLLPECASMLERLMLAQAQECVLDKAAADGKAAATLARLAKQVAVFYDETSRLLSAKPLGDHFDKSWQAHAAVKSLLYHLEADLYNAADLRTKDDLRGVANEIAQLKAAQIPLNAAKKEAKAASKDLQENVAEKERAIAERLAKAERENATVYLQRVPAAADLPGVVPAVLVKPVQPSDLTPAVDNMFRGVVPETTTKALSKYTDLVDSLIRNQTDALDAASDDARVHLRQWELPESLFALEAGSVACLPEGLRADMEKVASAGGLPHLHDLIAQLRNLRSVASTELDAVESELFAEAHEDDDVRAHYGDRWNRPPSAQINTQLWDKIKGYRSNLEAAGASDSKLERRLASDAAAFGALDLDVVAMRMPRLEAPMLSVDNMEPAAAVSALRAGLESLATLSSQRAALEQALRERKARDDVLPKLLARSGDLDALFAKELEKYSDLVNGVDDNVEKQRQVLQGMATANETFRRNYNFDEWRRDCEKAAMGVRATAKAYLEMVGNIGEGVRFYSTLQDAVKALRQQVGDYCLTRRLQREEMLAHLRSMTAAQEAAAAAQFAGLSVQPVDGRPRATDYQPQYQQPSFSPPYPPPSQQGQYWQPPPPPKDRPPQQEWRSATASYHQSSYPPPSQPQHGMQGHSSYYGNQPPVLPQSQPLQQQSNQNPLFGFGQQ